MPIPGECPTPDELGRAGWTILHTAAATFPYAPSAAQQEGMRKLVEGWSQVYACSHCAYHMREELKRHPVVTTGKRETSQYICELHNKVNKVLGKEEFSCAPDEVLRRWHPTYPEMADTPTIEEQLAAYKRQHQQEAEQKPKMPMTERRWWGGGGATHDNRGSEQHQPGTGPLRSGWGKSPLDSAQSSAAAPSSEPTVEELMKKVKACAVYCPEKKN